MEPRTPEEWFEYVFPKEGGKFYLVVGPRGSGKTTLGAAVMYRALTEHKGYACASNVMLKTRTQCPVHAEDAMDRCPMCWEPAKPSGYNTVTSMEELMRLLPKLLESNKTTTAVIDEAVLSTGFQAGTSVISQDVRSVLGLVTLLRKFRMNLMLIVLDEQAAMSKYREPGALLSGIFRRGVRLGGYDPKEIAELRGSLGSILVRVTPVGFAKPSDAAQIRDTVFATTSSASFSMGTLHGRPFDLMACLLAASNCYDWEVPDKLREYLKTGRAPSLVPPVEKSELEDEPEASQPQGPSTKQQSTKKGLKSIVDMRIRIGEKPASIVNALGVSSSFVYERIRIIGLEPEMDRLLASGEDIKAVAKRLNVPIVDARARKAKLMENP